MKALPMTVIPATAPRRITFAGLVKFAASRGVKVERVGGNIEFWRNSSTVGITKTVRAAWVEIECGMI